MLGPLTHIRPHLPGPGDQHGPASHPQMPPSLSTAYQEPWKLSLKIHCSYFLFYIFLASRPLVSEATGCTEAAHEEPDTGTHTRAVQSTQSKIKGKHVHGQGHSRPATPRGLPGKGHNRGPKSQRDSGITSLSERLGRLGIT